MQTLAQLNQTSQSMLLATPYTRPPQKKSSKNIFASLHSNEPLPALQKIKGKQYHAIGPKELRKMIIQEEKNPEENEKKYKQTTLSQTYMNTTINRQTILSKINKQQQNVLTKQAKQMNRYKEYKSYWDEQSAILKRKVMKKPNQKTLLQDNVKGLYIHDNEKKDDLINHYIVNFWQMSLRNNDKILKRHIKGNKFNEIQVEELLQTEKGIRTVERSIPLLPLDKLRKTDKRQLSLTGKSKFFSETNRTDISTRRLSQQQTQNKEEVYKINYLGGLKWLSADGLTQER